MLQRTRKPIPKRQHVISIHTTTQRHFQGRYRPRDPISKTKAQQQFRLQYEQDLKQQQELENKQAAAEAESKKFVDPYISQFKIRESLQDDSEPKIFVDVAVPSKLKYAKLFRRGKKSQRRYILPTSITHRRRIINPRNPRKRIKPLTKPELERKKLLDLGLHYETPDDYDSEGKLKFLDLPELPILYPPKDLIPKSSIRLFYQEWRWSTHFNALEHYQFQLPKYLNYTHQVPICSLPREKILDMSSLTPRFNSIHPAQEIVTQFYQWFSHFGGLIHPDVMMRPSNFSSNNYGDWGLYATKDIPAFTCIAVIPVPAMVQPTVPLFSLRNGVTVEHHDPKIFDYYSKASAFALHLRLFIELANYFESPFRPYFDTLPKAYPQSLLYQNIDQPHIKSILSNELRRDIELKQIALREEYEIISNFINTKVPKKYYANYDYTYDIFCQIEALIQTRAISIDRALIGDELHIHTIERDNKNDDLLLSAKNKYKRDPITGLPSPTEKIPFVMAATKAAQEREKKNPQRLPPNMKSRRILVPLLDMLNHDSCPNTTIFFGEYGLKDAQLDMFYPYYKHTTDWPENAIYLYTRRPVLSGQQFTRSYVDSPPTYLNHLPHIPPLDIETEETYLKSLLPLPILDPCPIRDYSSIELPYESYGQKWATSGVKRYNNIYGIKSNNTKDKFLPTLKQIPLPPENVLNLEYEEYIHRFPEINPLSSTSMSHTLGLHLARFPYLKLTNFTPSGTFFPHLELFEQHGISSLGTHLPYNIAADADPTDEDGKLMFFDERGHYFIKTPYLQDPDILESILLNAHQIYIQSLKNTNQYDALHHPLYFRTYDKVIDYYIQNDLEVINYSKKWLQHEKPPTIPKRLPLLFNPVIEELSPEIIELFDDLLTAINRRAETYDQSTQSITARVIGAVGNHVMNHIHGKTSSNNNNNKYPGQNSNSFNALNGPIQLDDKYKTLSLLDRLNKAKLKTSSSNGISISVQDLLSTVNNKPLPLSDDIPPLSNLYPFRFGLNFIAPELEAICYLLAAAVTNTPILHPGMYENLLKEIRDVFDPERRRKEKEELIRQRTLYEQQYAENRRRGYQQQHEKPKEDPLLQEYEGHNPASQNTAHQVRLYFAPGPRRDPTTDKFAQLHLPAYAILMSIMESILKSQNNKIYSDSDPKSSPSLIDTTQATKVLYNTGLTHKSYHTLHHNGFEREYLRGYDYLKKHTKQKLVKRPKHHITGRPYRLSLPRLGSDEPLKPIEQETIDYEMRSLVLERQRLSMSKLPIHNEHSENPFVLSKDQQKISKLYTSELISQFENIPNYIVQHIFNSFATKIRIDNKFWDIESIPRAKPPVESLSPNNLTNQINAFHPSRPIAYVPRI